MLCPVDEFSTEDPLPGPRPPWPGGQGDVSRRRSWGRNPGRKMLRAPRKNGGIIDVSWCFMIWNRDVFQFWMFRLEQGLEHWILRMFERHWVWKVWFLTRSGAPIFWSICLYRIPSTRIELGYKGVTGGKLLPVGWYPILPGLKS